MRQQLDHSTSFWCTNATNCDTSSASCLWRQWSYKFRSSMSVGLKSLTVTKKENYWYLLTWNWVTIRRIYWRVSTCQAVCMQRNAWHEFRAVDWQTPFLHEMILWQGRKKRRYSPFKRDVVKGKLNNGQKSSQKSSWPAATADVIASKRMIRCSQPEDVYWLLHAKLLLVDRSVSYIENPAVVHQPQPSPLTTGLSNLQRPVSLITPPPVDCWSNNASGVEWVVS